MIDWMKYRKTYFLISFIVIAFCAHGLVNWKMNLGVDFTGGTVIEYRVGGDFSTEEVTKILYENDIKLSSVQSIDEAKYLLKLSPITQEEKDNINEILNSEFSDTAFEELRYESVGPSIGSELIRKTIYASLIASMAILVWVAIQFKSLKFGTSAVFAMFHDTFILIGSFSVLGHFFGAEADFLFVTAVLTTLSFSVHDTIVVYDRIREFQSEYDGEMKTLANKAITETMVRSLNNSFTIIFMLLALLLLGGTTIRWFAAALLVGTILGTYSSPFVAVPLLVTWDELSEKFKKKK
jgi:preprotein translocase subunit SecF